MLTIFAQSLTVAARGKDPVQPEARRPEPHTAEKIRFHVPPK